VTIGNIGKTRSLGPFGPLLLAPAEHNGGPFGPSLVHSSDIAISAYLSALYGSSSILPYGTSGRSPYGLALTNSKKCLFLKNVF